jgi:BioD-like phosphotransacetylase family protein
MNTLVIASLRGSAGKTSLIVGLSKASGKNIGYMKPFGDRLLYSKKRLWDYDAALIADVFSISEEPETMSIGFDHSKLRFMYDRSSMAKELKRVIEALSVDRDAVLIECGKNLSHGASVYLDPLTISQETGYPVLIVAGGSEDDIADDLAFIERFVGSDEATVAGVIVNKVVHADDFREVQLPEIERLGVNVFGVIPYDKDLTTMTVATVAERLFARVVAGEDGLQRVVRKVAVGAMSVAAAMSGGTIKAADKMVITSGDRSDMILAAIEAGGTSAIVLTNNILPPSNVTSRASEKKIPLLLVPGDTYAVAMQVDKIEPLLTADETGKVDRLRKLVSEHVDLAALGKLL